MPKISVIIATFNRCEMLKKLLESLFIQTYGDFEILVVDNNSTDNTKSVVDQLRKKSGITLHYLCEARQGKSFALNNGIKKARGEILAFLDDDSTADKRWIEKIDATFTKYNADLVGGKIKNMYNSKPKWIAGRIENMLGNLDYGDTEFAIDSKKFNLRGGNWAFKNNVFEKIGTFNTKIGRIANKLLSGEDTEVFNKCLSKNLKIVYQPDALIFHYIPCYKLKKKYLFNLYFNDGISNSFFKFKDHKKIIGIPMWMIRDIVAQCISIVINKIRNFRVDTIEYQLQLTCNIGYIYGKLVNHSDLFIRNKMLCE